MISCFMGMSAFSPSTLPHHSPSFVSATLHGELNLTWRYKNRIRWSSSFMFQRLFPFSFDSGSDMHLPYTTKKIVGFSSARGANPTIPIIKYTLRLLLTANPLPKCNGTLLLVSLVPLFQLIRQPFFEAAAKKKKKEPLWNGWKVT